jgi:hypothetical protein
MHIGSIIAGIPDMSRHGCVAALGVPERCNQSVSQFAVRWQATIATAKPVHEGNIRLRRHKCDAWRRWP